MVSKFKFIDLFAGIGGIRIPFEELGGECVFSSEWDKFSQITYEANFGEVPHGDITKIDEKDIPKHDLLVGGFPCQAFSQAGLKKGFQDTRGTLFFDIARILKYHKPKAFLLENVKHLRGHDSGKTFNTIMTVLRELGYQTVEYKILNAKDFGVPQNRERIFIFGYLDFIFFQFPDPLNIKTKLGEILDEKIPEKYTISSRMWESAIRRKENNRKRGYGFGYSLFNKDSEYTSTISARYYKDGSEIWIDDGKETPRMLTPNEARKLQGFPEGFKIPVSDMQAYKQFGNSVSVPVIRAIAKKIVEHLN
jgi:DNA (cytosine-5)-methyltransferase 1